MVIILPAVICSVCVLLLLAGIPVRLLLDNHAVSQFIEKANTALILIAAGCLVLLYLLPHIAMSL